MAHAMRTHFHPPPRGLAYAFCPKKSHPWPLVPGVLCSQHPADRENRSGKTVPFYYRQRGIQKVIVTVVEGEPNEPLGTLRTRCPEYLPHRDSPQSTSLQEAHLGL